MEPIQHEDFSGIYYFTNPTKKERTFLWNNKEYTFEPETRSPIIINSESTENIQEIRKRWAYKLALERLYEGEILPSGYDYNQQKIMGNGTPPTFDEKILEPFIEECLKPLAIKRATVKEGKSLDSERNYKVTQAVSENTDLNRIFAEEPIQTLGKMSDS